MTFRISVLVAALAWSAPAWAQASRWADPYRAGVKAFEAKRCTDAIPQFERAVAADPKAEANKRIEGVFRTDYFPYYYLALCYVETQQWDKAAQSLNKARATLTRQQQAAFTQAETAIAVARATPAPNADDNRKRAFDAQAGTATKAISDRQWAAAMKALDDLRAIDADAYAKGGFGATRDTVVRNYASQIADEGRVLLNAQKYNEAKAKFQQADQTLPGQRAVAEALSDIKRREDDYQQLKAQALNDQNARNYQAARDALEQARSRHAELFASDNLAARLNDVTTQLARARTTTPVPVGAGVDTRAAQIQQLTRSAKEYLSQGKYADADTAYSSLLRLDPKNQEASDAIARSARFTQLRDRATRLGKSKDTAAARQALIDARGIDADRFTREGLSNVLDALAPPSPANVPAEDGAAAARAALQQALTALLSGRAQESIAILEPAAAKAAKSAPLHAYLGVAYATQALTAPKPDDRSRLQDKAVDQFKLAKSAQSDYELSARIVSPAIVSLYRSARP
jgi:tetratricopeptide (TPR) repeat protein